MKKNKFILIIICSLFLNSCHIENFMNNVNVFYANSLFSNGRVNEASAIYLDAATEDNAYVYYNLGNAFEYFEDSASANEVYNNAYEYGDTIVKIYTSYNKAVSAYNENNFKNAVSSFRTGIENYQQYIESKNGKISKEDEILGNKLSLAYQIALRAMNTTDTESAIQKGSIGLHVDGETGNFSMSRPSEKMLFISGEEKANYENDH